MAVSASQGAEYLRRYVEAYRQEYRRLTAPPPRGGGYPSLETSPYLSANELLCFLSPDGAAVVDLSSEPADLWWIAGGPALMADFPDSRTPPEVLELLKRESLWGKDIGICRLVAKDGLPDDVWQGKLEPILEEARAQANATAITVRQVELSLREVLTRLTFGTFGHIVPVSLPGPDTDFWLPYIFRQIGFLTADRQNRRFVNYMELTPHVDQAAWDPRSIFARVQADVRRDFALAFSLPSRLNGRGGIVSLGPKDSWIQPYQDRLSRLAESIHGFRALLALHGDEEENVFHDFLRANPILLDVYGEAISKPRFVYPEGQAPLGKTHVEPDFVIKYPGRSYRLVELERPSKPMATRQGQPRAEVTQATFQIAEWIAYIANHYDRIKDAFPGIALNCQAMVVMSRSNVGSFGAGRNIADYKELLRVQYRGVDILTYDDLLERAQQAYLRLSSSGITA
jgi:hypothetical protein